MPQHVIKLVKDDKILKTFPPSMAGLRLAKMLAGKKENKGAVILVSEPIAKKLGVKAGGAVKVYAAKKEGDKKEMRSKAAKKVRGKMVGGKLPYGYSPKA